MYGLLTKKEDGYKIFDCCGRCSVDDCCAVYSDVINNEYLDQLVGSFVKYELIDDRASVFIPPKLRHGFDTDAEFTAYNKGLEDGNKSS